MAWGRNGSSGVGMENGAEAPGLLPPEGGTPAESLGRTLRRSTGFSRKLARAFRPGYAGKSVSPDYTDGAERGSGAGPCIAKATQDTPSGRPGRETECDFITKDGRSKIER